MKIKLFRPHNGQKKIIDGFAESKHKFCTVSTGRQFGKSLLGQNMLLYWLLKNSKIKGGWISPTYNQAKKVFEEITSACNDIIVDKNKSELSIKLINGSDIKFLSAERYDNIRGFSFHYLIIDEGAFIRKQAMDEAILPTLSAIGKKCLMLSTPKSKNWFYEMFIKGLEENDNYISFRAISTDNPYIDKEFIETQKQSLPTEIFKQEYLAEFSEATSDVFRGIDNVCIIKQFNYNKNEKSYFGLDTGLQSDHTVITIMSETGRVLNVLRFRGVTFEEAGRRILAELNKYKIIGGYVETNSIGKAVYELIKPHYRNTKEFYTTQDSKTQAVRKLITDIENMAVELPSKELFPELYNELSAYTYKVSTNGKLSFSHPPGYHDDCVDSLWLVNMAREDIKSGGGLYIGNTKRI
jgi:hypothetical protein